MSYKHMPRLGSAIASTILSLFSGVLVVGVDKAQAAVLNYKFQTQGGEGFFKVSNSSLTGIGVEEIAVSEGKFNGVILNLPYMTGGKEFYDLATTARVIFYQGALVGLQAGGWESGTSKVMFPPNEYDAEPLFLHFSGGAEWSINTYTGGGALDSVFSGIGIHMLRAPVMVCRHLATRDTQIVDRSTTIALFLTL